MVIYDIFKVFRIWKWLKIGEKNFKYSNVYIFSDKSIDYI